MIVCGIDPGMTGAVAWFHNGALLSVMDLPMIEVLVSGKPRQQQSPQLLAALLFPTLLPESEWPDHVFLEQVGSRPGEGAVGAFSFGRGFGQIEGVLAGVKTPFTLVRPDRWKKTLGVSADKGQARAMACRLFPDMATKFARVKDDGRAEAALIGLYGVQQLRGAKE